MQCGVKFSSSCVFQDIILGKLIGNVKRKKWSLFFYPVPLLIGHPSFVYLKRLYPRLFGNKDIVSFNCEHCVLAKLSRNSHPPHTYKPFIPFHLIHSDIWGEAQAPTLIGTRWFITFIDDHSRLCWVYLMKEKSKTSAIFIQFHKLVQNLF